ncbi:hypothetical protein FN846DRAFT_471999 [Sphaerosporella brunnea]|uniref:Uncharacterized protein n=1 Tax=Sphaerosporella brunnea TaxID=1250544 RepID=A0A5J5EE01_9PEZI|nr:hypothetical protein FN846DRAFT_471999 [Sphaerosporella brunnea]
MYSEKDSKKQTPKARSQTTHEKKKQLIQHRYTTQKSSNHHHFNRRNKHLLATTETEDQVEGRLLLNVVVGKSPTVLELLTSENETLLIRGNTLFVLDLALHVVDGIRRLHLEGDGLSGQSLDENLHTTTETKDQVESGLLLDVVVREGAAILKLLTSEDETLLIRGNALLFLNLVLDIIDGIGRLHLKGDGLSSHLS